MSTPLRRTTRQHRSGNSFSVRIPRDLAYPVADQELEIEASGDTLILRPKRDTFAELMSNLDEAYAAGATGLGDDALVRPDWPASRERG